MSPSSTRRARAARSCPPSRRPGRTVVTATKTGGERNEALFGEFFVEAFGDAAADADRNGHVSVLEAFNYAKNKVVKAYEQGGLLRTEHATTRRWRRRQAGGDAVSDRAPGRRRPEGRRQRSGDARARRRARSHPEGDRRAEGEEGHARSGALRSGDGEAADRASRSRPRRSATQAKARKRRGPNARRRPRSLAARPSALAGRRRRGGAAFAPGASAAAGLGRYVADRAERAVRRAASRSSASGTARRSPFAGQRFRWSHDYPLGEQHFMKILNELTYLEPHTSRRRTSCRSTTRISFKYPVAYMTEPGYWDMTDEEAATFRAYLQKGGFVIFDDFAPRRGFPERGGGWGSLRRCVPPGPAERAVRRSRRVAPDLSRRSSRSSSFDIVPQTYDDGRPIFRGIFEDNDPNKRLMAIINYNTDISEYWEWSDTGLKPIDESNEAYKLGVNYIIYGMTH